MMLNRCSRAFKRSSRAQCAMPFLSRALRRSRAPPAGLCRETASCGSTLTKGDRYAVATVNLPEGTHSSKTQIAGRVEFVCDADKHRAIVDTEASGAPHYRAWNKPRSLTEKPDMEISKGKKDYEGSGPCAQIIWTFTTGVTKFVVEGPGGCHEDSHQPPADTQGRLKVSTPGTPDVSWWCR